MATITVNTVNAVSFGKKHVATAADATAEEITFQVGDTPTYELGFTIMVVRSGVFIPLTDAKITYPADYSVKLANGAATFAITAADVITVIGSPVE